MEPKFKDGSLVPAKVAILPRAKAGKCVQCRREQCGMHPKNQTSIEEVKK